MTVVTTTNIHELSAADGGLRIGNSITEKLGFYGLAAPIVQRSGAAQATTAVAVSASFGATQLAALQECMNTLAALGLWKGGA